MPEIVRNLTAVRFLRCLGILVWLSEFELVFGDKICNNNQDSEFSLLHKLTLKSYFETNFKSDLALFRGSFLLPLIFFAYEYFILSFSHTSILSERQFKKLFICENMESLKCLFELGLRYDIMYMRFK